MAFYRKNIGGAQQLARLAIGLAPRRPRPSHGCRAGLRDHGSPEAELRLDLAAAIEALPLHYREVALMRDVKEMTMAEIAIAPGVTHQTVKARLHRARLRMREYLAM